MKALMEEIAVVVQRLRALQDSERLTDRELLRRFPDLGSSKTWRQRLVTGELGDLNLDRTVKRLRRIALILDGGSPEDEFYPDLPFAVEMTTQLERLESQTNDRRILVCLAPNGCGKTLFARWAVAQRRSTRALLRIRPTWRNKKLHLCKAILRALGKDTSSSNASEVENDVIVTLSSTPRTVFIDQAHEGGVELMHELRAFVDETPARFVYLAYATAYNRVVTANTDALIEAQAFLGRCLKPPFDLYKAGTRVEDVAYLLRRAGLNGDAGQSLAADILSTLNGHTNLRLLDDAIDDVERAAEGRRIDADELKHRVMYLAGREPLKPDRTEKDSDG